MKADKVTVTITVETLSIDSIFGLIKNACEQIDGEFENGSLIASDGDTIKWETERKKVEF